MISLLQKTFSLALFLFLFPVLSHAGSVQWLSYEETLKRADTEDRLIYLYFYSDRCPWCVRMDREVLESDKVSVFLNEHFLSARIRVEDRPDIAEKFRVRGFPAHFFLSQQARDILLSRPGYIPDGSFLRMLQYMNENGKNVSSE